MQKKKTLIYDFNHFYPFIKKDQKILFFKKLIGILAIVSLLIFTLNNAIIYFVTVSLLSERIIRGEFIVRSLIYLYPFVYIVMIIQAFKHEKNSRKKYAVSNGYGLLIVGYNIFWMMKSIIGMEIVNSSFVVKQFQQWQGLWEAFSIFVLIITSFIIISQIILLIIGPKINKSKIHEINRLFLDHTIEKEVKNTKWIKKD